MTETTTIEVTKAQKEQLDRLKDADRESYKAVLDRVIANYEKTIEGYITEGEAREIAREEIEAASTRY
jgi:predicted transcriptional regulator